MTATYDLLFHVFLFLPNGSVTCVFFCLSESWSKGHDSGWPSDIPLLITAIAGNLCQGLCFCDERPFIGLKWLCSYLSFASLHLYPLRPIPLHLASSQPGLARPVIFSRNRQSELETVREAPAMASCLLFSSPFGFWCASGYVQTALPSSFFWARWWIHILASVWSCLKYLFVWLCYHTPWTYAVFK